jgi:hypothetical protein
MQMHYGANKKCRDQKDAKDREIRQKEAALLREASATYHERPPYVQPNAGKGPFIEFPSFQKNITSPPAQNASPDPPPDEGCPSPTTLAQQEKDFFPEDEPPTPPKYVSR